MGFQKFPCFSRERLLHFVFHSRKSHEKRQTTFCQHPPRGYSPVYCPGGKFCPTNRFFVRSNGMSTKHGSLSFQSGKRLLGGEMILKGYDNDTTTTDIAEVNVRTVHRWRQRLKKQNDAPCALARKQGSRIPRATQPPDGRFSTPANQHTSLLFGRGSASVHSRLPSEPNRQSLP